LAEMWQALILKNLFAPNRKKCGAFGKYCQQRPK
jgi:hypothetical protein